MPIELIGLDREPVIFIGYEQEARDTYQLLFLLPVAGEVDGTASSAETFIISSPGRDPIVLERRVQCYEPGEYGERIHFLHPTIQSAFLPVTSRECNEAIQLPCMVTTEPMSPKFTSRRAIVSLAYRRFELDPVHQSRSLEMRAVPIGYKGTKFCRGIPYNPMNFRFEEGDRVPVWIDAANSDHRIIMQFESIPKIGTATVSLLTWEPIELKPGMLLKRCKSWDQMSEVDGHLYRRYIEADFAVIRELL